MRLYVNHSNRSRRAFTMVEIALSIAVVAFALVAILGVLPTGMTVQKDNRDDNIINQEGRYWLEAIRSGSLGLEEITNFVESVTITNLTKARESLTFNNGAASPLTPEDIISLLSTPKLVFRNNEIETNRVSARVKALTGPASEKGPLTNEFSFRYEMQVELTPNYPGAMTPSEQARVPFLSEHLHELRLVFRWPVVQRGNGWLVGNNRKTFRARVAGQYQISTNITSQVASRYKSSVGRDASVILPNRFNIRYASN